MGWNVCTPLHGVITIRCTRSRGPRGFFCLHVFRRGPVNVDVMRLETRTYPMEQNLNNTPEWRRFEQMVSRIERDAGRLGLIVMSPDRIRSLITGDLREVDASIRSRDGDSKDLVTIECRKRASKEDVTWIEQLATKKEAIGAVRTIAVSSSGFSKQARKAAAHYGIDLRLISEITLADINPILQLDFVLFNHKRCSIASVGFRRFRGTEWTLPSPDDIDFQFDRDTDPLVDIFHNSDNGTKWSLNDLWHQLQESRDPFAEIERGKPPVFKTACFPYPGNVKVVTPAGTETLGDVIISVALSIDLEKVAFEDTKKIGYAGTGEVDLQRIEFNSANCPQGEWSVALQMPRSSTNADDVRVRLISPDDKNK